MTSSSSSNCILFQLQRSRDLLDVNVRTSNVCRLDLITNKYICPMNCPATPQKKPRKNGSTEFAVESPYFSAPKRPDLLELELEDEDVFEIQASLN